MTAKRVCVVGAGPSGLVATKTLIEAGLDAACFEMSSEIGGHWVYDNPNGRSAAYKSLETNTTKKMSRLSDFTMPDDWPEFPNHAQVRDWFNSYADHFGLRGHIRSNCEVVTVQPLDSGGWATTIREAGGTISEEEFDALIAASGNYWAQKMPEFEGEFAGQIIHAQTYREPQSPIDTEGKHVVIVGIGNTGCELACELANSKAASVSLSARSGYWILPKLIDGAPAAGSAPMTHPTDPVPPLFVALPRRIREPLFMAFMERMFKKRFAERMERFNALGLPPAPPSPLSKRPTVAQDLMPGLESGAITPRPAIKRLDGRSVEFADGTRVEADLIICATGYRLVFPYLPREVLDPRSDDVNLYMGTMHPDRPSLFVVGVSRPTGAFWPIAEAQAKFAAAIISGSSKLPKISKILRDTGPILNRTAFNPALYGLALREEIARGRRR